jgi:hypothetical protein
MGQNQSTIEDRGTGTEGEEFPTASDFCFEKGMEHSLDPPSSEDYAWETLGCHVYGKEQEYDEGYMRGMEIQQNTKFPHFQPTTPAAQRHEEECNWSTIDGSKSTETENEQDRLENNNNNNNNNN